MNQKLNVTISVPENYILINKLDWEEMLEAQLSGRQWEMKDLVERTGRSPQWLKDNILYPYKDELCVKKGGFIKYPETKGSPWRFGAVRMSQWLESNLDKVM